MSSAACKVTAETKEAPKEKASSSGTSSPKDTRKPGCASFEGGKLTATWTGCPDGVKREVSCATFIDDLKCDCLEDGAKKWFFSAKDPPLSTRADATRVANKECHWSLE